MSKRHDDGICYVEKLKELRKASLTILVKKNNMSDMSTGNNGVSVTLQDTRHLYPLQYITRISHRSLYPKKPMPLVKDLTS